MYKKIAIFDSGVGGIGTLKLLSQKPISEEIIYYADNQNIPFGSKNKNELITICQNAVDLLEGENVELIIFACNTASSVIPKLKSKVKIISIIDYAKKGLENIKNSQNTLVVATKATINSGIYQSICDSFNIKADFINPADFVELVEAMKTTELKEYFHKYFSKNNYEYILYACTHYPFLDSEFNNYFLKATTIDPAKIMVDCLEKSEIPVLNSAKPILIFKASKDTTILKRFYERMFDV